MRLPERLGSPITRVTTGVLILLIFEGEIDGRRLFFMEIPPSSIPIAMVREEAPHTSYRGFEVMDKAASKKLDKFLAVLGVNPFDPSHLTFRNTVVS